MRAIVVARLNAARFHYDDLRHQQQQRSSAVTLGERGMKPTNSYGDIDGIGRAVYWLRPIARSYLAVRLN